MPRKFDPDRKDALVSAKRRKGLDVLRVVSLIPILPYHVIADIGCGPGYFAIPLGKHVYGGRVHAIDVQQEMLDATRVELERVHLTNVDLVLSEEKTLPLEDDSLDGAFAAFVVHEADDPRALLNDARRCLRKSGWLALLEWHKRKTDDGPPVKERIAEEKLRELALKVGFRFSSRHTLNEDQYMLLMRK